VIAGGGLWFNRQQRERELETARQQREREVEIADRRAQDEALQAYLDQIGHLLLDKDRPLRQSKEGDEMRTLAQARTLTVLARLDGGRKGSLIQFLYDSGLVRKDHPVLDLKRADLTEANLSGAELSGVNLRWVFLHGADLFWADLSAADLKGANLKADLTEANLTGANLTGAFLTGANLRDADLSGAYLEDTEVTREQLDQAYSLEGATMPNGQKYEDWLKSKENGKDE